MIVYKLYHTRELEDGAEGQKLIGIYSTEEKAKAALVRVQEMPGFRDFPDGFEIFDHLLDRDSWTEGFISWDEASKDPK